MGFEIDPITKTIAPTQGDAITTAGKKINQVNSIIAISEVNQTVFTLPFTYVAGDAADVIINGRAVLHSKFSISGSTLTWLGAALDVTDELIVWG